MLSFLKDKEFIRKFNKISLPVMASSLITFFVNLLDNLMVGTVSNSAVSGVYAANQITFIFQMACFGILEGAGIFIQQYNGSKDNDHISQCVKYKWLIIAILLVIAVPLLYALSPYLISIQCAKDEMAEEILKEGLNYFYIMGISYIPFSISCVIYQTFQETGNTKYAMYSSILALFTNSLLNAILIFAFNMGVKGAAIATLVSRICEMILLFSFTNRKKYPFFNMKNVKIEKELYKGIFKKGTFLFINEMGFTIGVILQNFALSQRDGVLSSISIVSTVTELFHVFGIGFAIGCGVLIGSYLGQNKFDESRENAKNLLKLGLLITVIISICLIILSPFIPMLYKEVTESQKEISTILIIILSCVLPTQIFALGSYYILRAGGRTRDTLIFDTGSTLLLYVPVSWILALFTPLNIIWIFAIVRGIDILKAILGMYLLKSEKWLQNITITE